jgi:flagellar protein FliO/FliZ
VLNAVLSLAMVFGLMGGLLWWLRRFSARGRGANRHIRVVETVELGPGKCLHLVELAGRGLLVGSTGQRCELLCEVENLEEQTNDVRRQAASWVGARHGHSVKSSH